MTQEQSEAAIATAEKEYADARKSNRDKLLRPVLAEVSRLNAVARRTKDNKVKHLRAWLAVLAAGVKPPEESVDGN